MAAKKQGAKAGAKEAPAEAPEAAEPEEGELITNRQEIADAERAGQIARRDAKLAYEEAAKGL